MWWVPIRAARLQWHIARGVWLTSRARRYPAPLYAEHVQRWLAGLLTILNIHPALEGTPPAQSGHLWVANHVSWLDIPLLGGLLPNTVFLAKEEIQTWPIIGGLAEKAGTLFMARGTGSVGARHALTQGLTQQRHVVIFPEATTTAGHTVKRFHARLIQPAIDAQVPVQPVALRYLTATGEINRSAAYIDDDALLSSLWRILRAKKIEVRVAFLTPITAKTAPPDITAHTRDAIAQLAESRIRAALQRWDADGAPKNH